MASLPANAALFQPASQEGCRRTLETPTAVADVAAKSVAGFTDDLSGISRPGYIRKGRGAYVVAVIYQVSDFAIHCAVEAMDAFI